jgi:hypothetical protein
LAVITGAVSSVVVLDVDKPDFFKHPVPDTLTAKTSRGHHYYFKHPGFEVRTTHLGFGELKGDGGLVIAPPSVHPDGSEYEWTCIPDGELIAEMPDWLPSC